jgi:hypothetical protein
MQLQLVVAMYIIWVTPLRVVRGQRAKVGGTGSPEQLLSSDAAGLLRTCCACEQPGPCTEVMPCLAPNLTRQGFNMPAEGIWFWLEGMIDVFFYVDLALNFFVAYEVCRAAGV